MESDVEIVGVGAGCVEGAVESPDLDHAAACGLGGSEEAYGVGADAQGVAGEGHGGGLRPGEELAQFAGLCA